MRSEKSSKGERNCFFVEIASNIRNVQAFIGELAFSYLYFSERSNLSEQCSFSNARAKRVELSLTSLVEKLT